MAEISSLNERVMQLLDEKMSKLTEDQIEQLSQGDEMQVCLPPNAEEVQHLSLDQLKECLWRCPFSPYFGAYLQELAPLTKKEARQLVIHMVHESYKYPASDHIKEAESCEECSPQYKFHSWAHNLAQQKVQKGVPLTMTDNLAAANNSSDFHLRPIHNDSAEVSDRNLQIVEEQLELVGEQGNSQGEEIKEEEIKLDPICTKSARQFLSKHNILSKLQQDRLDFLAKAGGKVAFETNHQGLLEQSILAAQPRVESPRLAELQNDLLDAKLKSQQNPQSLSIAQVEAPGIEEASPNSPYLLKAKRSEIHK